MPNQHDHSQDQFWSLLSKKFSGEATPEELQELQTVLLKNPDLHYHADMINDMWQQETKNNTAETEAAYMRHVMKHKEEFFIEPDEKIYDADPLIENKNSFKLFSRKSLLILSILTALAAGTFYLLTSKKNSDNPQQAISSVVTPNGNRSKIVLPDGSQVWLNAGSKLDYDNVRFNQSLREVHLDGEAYFDVVKNPQKPFLVHTDNMQIRVLGTAFDVKSYSEDKESETSLIHGSVEVTIPGRQEKFVLHPNEKIVVSNIKAEPKLEKLRKERAELKDPETIISIKKMNYLPEKTISIETAWVENRLEFHSEKFSEVANKMERWFDVTITFSDKKLEDIVFTGPLPGESIVQALEALKFAESFNYTIEGKRIIIKP